MSEYLYFLSYARDDRNNDVYNTIRNFSRELEMQVRLLRPSQDNVSFFDGNDIEPGDIWPETLSEALCRSRVFVPIYSPTYFTRKYCGREWQIFRNRLDSYKAQNPAANVNKLIQPVLLVSPEAVQPYIPKAVSRIQITYDEYPQEYQVTGLRSIRRAGVTKAEYADFVNILADRILKVADECTLPPLDTRPEIEEITSAFEQPAAPVISTRDVTKTRGPRYVQFIFVAGKRSELRTIRESFDCYGEEGGLDWQPFLPPEEDEIAVLAQEIAAKEKLRYETVPLGVDTIQRIEEAEQKSKLVVVIVDTWTLRLERYREFARRYDNTNFINCVVLIPQNQNDDESMSSDSFFEQTLRSAFPKKWLRKDPSILSRPIGSADELKKHLSESLRQSRALVMQYSMDMEGGKPVTSEERIYKPVLDVHPGQVA